LTHLVTTIINEDNVKEFNDDDKTMESRGDDIRDFIVGT
jgi:hypothetical protein